MHKKIAKKAVHKLGQRGCLNTFQGHFVSHDRFWELVSHSVDLDKVSRELDHESKPDFSRDTKYVFCGVKNLLKRKSFQKIN